MVSTTTPPTSGGVTLATLSRFRLRERRLLFHKDVGDTLGSDIPRCVVTPRGILARGGGGLCVVPVYLVTFSLAVSGCLNLRVP